MNKSDVRIRKLRNSISQEKLTSPCPSKTNAPAFRDSRLLIGEDDHVKGKELCEECDSDVEVPE
jgi:hypothetical protein